MKPTDLYTVLVCCNDSTGNFMRRTFGVEIFAPADDMDAVLEAETPFPDGAIPFRETRHGVQFEMNFLTEGAPLLNLRLFYPCAHGAQHVGNIFWNAYFLGERHAKRLAVDILQSVDFHCDGEWADREADLRAEVEQAERERREFLAHPRLPLRFAQTSR